MTARHVVLALTAGLVLAPVPAHAAGECPTSYVLVDAATVSRQLTPEQRKEAKAVGGVDALFAQRDLNGNGLLCQQVDSLGRAPGQPSFFANYKDDRA